MKTAILIPSPFPGKHCVPLAFASCSAQPTPIKAKEIAVRAKARGILSKKGGAVNVQARRHAWASLAGLRIVEWYIPDITVRYRDWGYFSSRRTVTGRPTLAQFLATRGRTGRWVVQTYKHCQAVVDGVLVQYGTPRSRVIQAWRVEEA